MRVKDLGQVFTPDFIVDKILSLRRNKGRCMEPSCGDGAISSRIDGVFAIEYDGDVCPSYAHNMDFFDYDINNKFETIIGNPPYVKYNDINPDTKSRLDYSLFDKRSNLYLFFIKKCIDHLTHNGELIFIVPRDFLKSTSSIKLNEYIYNMGTITDVVDYGDMILFKGFSPNCIVFRFEKNNFSRRTVYENAVENRIDERNFVCNDGQLCFLSNDYLVKFGDLFFVKVGGVSGADNIFANDEFGNMDFVCSETCRTGKTRRMVYDELNDYLMGYEKELRERKIMKITDDNWKIVNDFIMDEYNKDNEIVSLHIKRDHRNQYRWQCSVKIVDIEDMMCDYDEKMFELNRH